MNESEVYGGYEGYGKDEVVIELTPAGTGVTFVLSIWSKEWLGYEWGKASEDGVRDKRVLIDEEGKRCPERVFFRSEYGDRFETDLLTHRFCRFVIEILTGRSVEGVFKKYCKVVFRDAVSRDVVFVWKA